MKAIKEHFERAPYGFVDEDVFYLVARLFKRGEIAFTLQGEYVTLANRGVKDILDYIEKKVCAEKLMIEKRERVSDKEKKIVRELMKELFGNSTASDDEDALMSTFLSHTNGLMEELQRLSGQMESGKYPGRNVVDMGIKVLNQIRDTKTSSVFFKAAAKLQDDLFKFIDDYENVRKFFDGAQKKHFDDALKTYHIYAESQNYLSDIQLEKIANQIQQILQNPKPYRQIKDLPVLREQFNDVYDDILTEKAKPVKETIEVCSERIITELSNRPYKESMKPRVIRKFDELREAAVHSNNVNQLISLETQAEAVKNKFLNEIAAEDTRLAKEEEEKKHVGEVVKETENTVVPETVKADNTNTTPGYTPKKTVYLTMREAAGIHSIEIKDEAALDTLLAKLKEKFMQELKERDSIHIDF